MHADERTRSDALAQITRDAPIDLRGVTLDDSLLHRVLRALPTDGHDRSRWNALRLDGATIEPGSPLDLAGHEFTEYTSWRGVRVLRPLILRNARLTLADFRDATFDEHVDAEAATFAGGPRFDDARFRAGCTLDDARFDGGFDLRRASGTEVLLANATVNGDADVSLARLGTLDLGGGRMSGDLIIDGAHIERVVLTGTAIDGVVRAARAQVRHWEPAFRSIAGGAIAAMSAATLSARAAGMWRADLLGTSSPAEHRWVTVEEWVGHTEAVDRAGYRSGVIGLQVAPWPAVDDTGKPMFDDAAVRIVAVDADALADVLAELLDDQFTPLHVGDVYALQWSGTLPTAESAMDGEGLRALGVTRAADITTHARDAAKAAFWSVLVPPLDADADAPLISAITSAAEDAR